MGDGSDAQPREAGTEEEESRQKEKRAIVEARARYAFALGVLGVKDTRRVTARQV
jgi:hypothetical protein